MEQERKLSFDEYKEEVWLPRHQASIPVEEEARSPYPGWSRAAALIGFLASALISGVHVVPSVYAGIPVIPIVPEWLRVAAAYASFLAYEFGMFMAAFLMPVEATKKLAQWMTRVIFATLILVNLNSVIEVYGLNIQENLVGAGVSLAFALVPVIAYASGKFFINIEAGERAAQRKAKEAVREEYKKLDALINAAYTKYTKEFDERLEHARERLVRTESVPSMNGYDTDQGVRTEYVPSMIPGTASMRTGVPSKAVRDLADVLKQNPDDIQLSAAKIRAKYGTGQTVANDAKKLALGELNGK